MQLIQAIPVLDPLQYALKTAVTVFWTLESFAIKEVLMSQLGMDVVRLAKQRVVGHAQAPPLPAQKFVETT